MLLTSFHNLLHNLHNLLTPSISVSWSLSQQFHFPVCLSTRTACALQKLNFFDNLKKLRAAQN